MKALPLLLWCLSLALFAVACGNVSPASLSETLASRELGDLEHDVYVWQRRHARVSEALKILSPKITSLRVLALEREKNGKWVTPKVDAIALKRYPLVVVARINGHRWPDDNLALRLQALTREWRSKGLNISGIEIDFDSATAGLGEYQKALRPLRALGYPLSITALPTWLNSDAFTSLGRSVDEMVLQVHAVNAGVLFDPQKAKHHVQTFMALSLECSRSVALPNYTVPTAAGIKRASALELQDFLRGLPLGLRKVVWFRLPIPGDAHTWSSQSFHHVLKGNELRTELVYALVSAQEHGADIEVWNKGTLDVLPQKPQLKNAEAFDFLPLAFSSLPPGVRRVLGWANGDSLEIHP